MASSSRREQRVTRELIELARDGFVVANADDPTREDFDTRQFSVALAGPPDTPYEGGVWYVRFTLGPEFPFKSPSVGFVNRVWHPNVREECGSVCLDVLNDDLWKPQQTLSHVMSAVLPLFLANPNPRSPLNHDAAAQLERQTAARAAATATAAARRDEHEYDDAVRAHARRCAFRYTAPPSRAPAGAEAASARRSERLRGGPRA
jgi:ubiquitin-protein ligase